MLFKLCIVNLKDSLTPLVKIKKDAINHVPTNFQFSTFNFQLFLNKPLHHFAIFSFNLHEINSAIKICYIDN